jgi:hypothetical protein
VPIVNYPISIPYRVVPNIRGTQPAAEVTLFHGDLQTSAVGIFDSGSLYTVFGEEHAALIGIDDVTTGNRERVSTLGGPKDVFLFDLEIRLAAAGRRLGAQIGFFQGQLTRNILGRNVIFSAFEIGFYERVGVVNLRACD